MADLLTYRLALFSNPECRVLLEKGLRGVEREALRVTTKGHLATTPHPHAFGSALTNTQITTDYSESLLEFITPATHDISIALQYLDEIHRFVYSKLHKNELLWNASMPCNLPHEEDIPIAWYGTSNIGMLKHIYRRGLGLRYGKVMQCIAGIHYNFSLNKNIWILLRQVDNNVKQALSQQDYQSACYIALIRNFRRYSWLLIYLLGASPALTKNFLRGRSHQLQRLSNDTFFLPYATSLRMSNIGYQSYVQTSIKSNYNNLCSYLKNLSLAINQSYPEYEKIGTKRNNEWLQINTNILQIENEYYSTIRPKPLIMKNERPIQALIMRGVQYVEVRCLDIDPFESLSISLQTSRFLDVFLHFLAFEVSPLTADKEAKENYSNFSRTVTDGRRPGLKLYQAGQPIYLQDWGLILLERMYPIAVLLDTKIGGEQHVQALVAQRNKLLDSELTPSARVLKEIRATNNSFSQFILQQSQMQAAKFLAQPLSIQKNADFIAMAKSSLITQKALECNQIIDFDRFIATYYANY